LPDVQIAPPARRLSLPIISMVTSRRRYGHGAAALERLEAAVTRAAEAGVDLVQVRERDLDAPRLVALVAQLGRAVRHTQARILVNARIDIAVIARAHGVHLPAAAPSAARVRTAAPRDFIVGRSVHSREEAIAAAAQGGCDYLTFGTVFPSLTKPAEHPAVGTDALREVCSAVSLPVLAIGGVTEARAGEIAAAGAAGVAAIGLFADALDERRLRDTIARMRAHFKQ